MKNLPPIDKRLIESYYMTAEHLRSNAEQMLRTAEMLAATADRMTEENIRLEGSPAPQTGDESG